jgi:hypothetical protein
MPARAAPAPRPRLVTPAASVIPIGDAAIVLAHGGPAYAAYGTHGATAAVAIAAAAVRLSG